METKIFKRDYKVIISFDNADQLVWTFQRKGEPYTPRTKEEWQLILDAVSEIKMKVNTLIMNYSELF